jgi:crotonobetainyl-CoA:carnitine CoA-transferase CaiB-like acyl-CoA transferase
MGLPLEDVRVLAIEQFGAGPWATLQLADLGAEVIKIEDPASAGDVARYIPPYQDGEDSLFFETFNHAKKSVSLDLRHERGREVFEDLVRASDAVFSNLRGDAPGKLRITYEHLKAVNPKVVCVSLTGFGTTGPRAAEAGYDYTIQGLAGWMSLTGEPDGPPAKTGLSLVDLSGGYAAAIALLAGLHGARRDGVGCDADISLFETALHQLIYVGTWVATVGHEPQRRGESSHPSIVPFQLFATADGWITVACAKPKFWERFCHATGRGDLLEDPRYADFPERDHNRDTLLPVLRSTLRARTTAEWLEIFSAHRVPHGPVNDVAAALDDPQAVARGVVVESEHPTLGTVRGLASPLRLGGGPPRPVTRAPFRGEHTEELLRELCGYEAARLEELRAAGVFGAQRQVV